MSELKRTVVYYLREERTKLADDGSINYFKVPRTVVVLLENEDGEFARGVAMCSNLDVFNKKQGRGMALNRALAAFKAKKNIGPINRGDVIIEDGMDFKIEFQPILTEYEKRLLKGPKED